MRTPGVMDGFDGICSHILELYSTLHFKPPPGQFTILASFVLSNKDNIKVISLATGSKCLPTVRLSERGDAVHDSHAEILARRAAIRWFLEEASRSQSHSRGSNWIIRQSDGRYGLQDTVQLSMYISTPPCAAISLYNHYNICSNFNMKVVTLQCASWHHSRTRKWQHLRMQLCFLICPQTLPLEVETITHFMVSCGQNLVVQILHRHCQCHVAIKWLLGM